MNIPPDAAAAMQARYTGKKSDGPSLMDGDVAVPTNDQEALKLIQDSKAAIDANGGINKLTPAMKAHVKAVVSALEQYADTNPSPVAQRLMSGIRSDPALAPYL